MKKRLLFLCLLKVFSANAQIANHVVISEVYGGGGNTGATYTHDFIELYNPTAAPVSLAGWSVQYAAAAGTSWTKTDLTGSIPAYGFYLVREAMGTGGTTALPAPDASGSIAMSGTAGKVALVNNGTVLTGTCPAGAQIIDFVGFGTTANCFEGAGPTPAPGNTTSVERKASATSTAVTLAPGGSEELAGNGYDSNSNNTDFVAGAVNPQNSSSPAEGGPAGNSVAVKAGLAPAEPATNGSFIITLNAAAPAGGITITYTLAGTATPGTDYTDVQGGTLFIPAGATTGTISINVIDDAIADPDETIIVTLTSASGGYAIAGATATIVITDDEVSITPVSTIQGAGATATAGRFTAEAIVTAVYPLLSPAGFYMQEEDADADADPNTSEGIFVVSAATVAVGDKVRVTGDVLESAATPSFGQAVFNNATVAIQSNNAALPAATDIMLPVGTVSDFEKYEGMLVRFPGTLTVTNNYTLGRFGEVGLSAGGAVYQPTQIIDPNDAVPGGTNSTGKSNVAAINALIQSNAARTILLDDGRNTTTTLPYADPVDNTLRLGSTINDLTGIMGYAFNVYRIQPIPAALPVFTYAQRPAVPSVGTANIKIGSFNVLNYFNGNGTGGGFPTSRGANTPAEFSRQRTKIISAITQLNADVVGLLEMENDGTGPNSAVQDLVNGLNAVAGPGTYSIINDGATVQTFGTDEIRCAIIYKPAVVTPVGAVMLSGNTIFNRPPVAQTFTVGAAGPKFNFVINHFKSKGCTAATGADLDQGDGQSCYNNRRKSQAVELLNFFNTTVIPTSGTDRIISVGDYNSYYEEDPLDILRAGDYTVLSSSSSYSYQFDGQIGSLDHALVSRSLNTSVSGIAKWNINAAEPVYLDYNDDIDDGGSDIVNPFGYTYTPGPFRSSDHDPVLIGLNLTVPLPVVLTGFTAVAYNKTAQLQWSTAQEVNSDRFIIERSADGDAWDQIVAVPASGNKNNRTSYTAYDAHPLTGTNLYRLKSVDLDGRFGYSAVNRVVFNTVSETHVYPNPAEGTLHISLREKQAVSAQIEIFNTMQQQLLTDQVNSNGASLSVDISSLVAGIYYVRITLNDGSSEVLRFVKK